MAKEERLVEVYTASGEIEARLVEGLLELNGIASILRSDAASSVHPFTVDGMGEVKVMVYGSMADEARRIIGGE